MYMLLILLLCATVWLGCPSDVPVTSPYAVDDVQFPKECPQIAKAGDHIMFEYVLSSGTKVHASQVRPEHFHHVVLADEDSTLHRTLKGMCENSTRILRFTGAGNKLLFLPPLMPAIEVDAEDGNTDFKVMVRHITSPEDYGIFQAMRMNNFSSVIDMIDDQLGVNAIDEFGQNVLMTAVQRGVLPVVAGLLNARRPRVDIDMEKGNGFSALFYAVDLPNVSIMQALLRRGANPNKQLNSEGNRGNTPLHLSCRLDKKDHAKMLLEYGALPAATNDYGQVPLQLVPRDSVTSNKRAFLKHFEAAAKRLSEAAADGLELPVGNNVPLNGGEL